MELDGDGSSVQWPGDGVARSHKEKLGGNVMNALEMNETEISHIVSRDQRARNWTERILKSKKFIEIM